MGLLVAGGVVQTHLRFSERDLEIQTRLAQEDLASLSDDRVALEAQVEALRSGQQVRDRAITELGLVPPSPTEVHRLEIDDALWAKYAGDGTEEGPLRSLHEEEPPWMEWIDRTMWVADSSSDGGTGR